MVPYEYMDVAMGSSTIGTIKRIDILTHISCTVKSLEGMLNVFIALGFLCLVELAYAAPDRYENLQEWSVWKGHHQRSYESQLQEMERHSIWIANKKYIEHHNANADLFGYTLAMNSFGDLVRKNISAWMQPSCVYNCMHAYKVYTCIKKFIICLRACM